MVPLFLLSYSSSLMKNLFLKASQMDFGSWSYNSPAFESFARSLKAEINKICKFMNWKLTFNKWHFYCSGFISDSTNGHVYFSTSDVRWKLQDHILIRTAKNTKDFTWWTNEYTNYEDFGTNVNLLLMHSND